MNSMLWFLSKLTADLKIRDWAFLTRLPELHRDIYVVGMDGTSVVADHPDDLSEMPWYVVLTLSAFSKKHVFAPCQ